MEPVQSNVLSTTTNTLSTTTSTLKTTLTRVTALRWSQPASEVTATATIGSNGGTISAGGITLTVPRGAVSKSTQFRVTRVAGNVVAYEFEPHGARFAKPLTITQSTAGTNFRSMPATLVRGAYFTDRSLIDQLLGTVLVAEFRTATVSSDRATVRFTVDHFSGYMVSMD